MQPSASMKDQHYVVTGAGTGIGRAIALRLAQGGARLSLLARNTDRLQDTAAAAKQAGAAAVFLAGCDIRQRAAVDDAFGQAAEAQGPLRGLVANAGIGGPNSPGPDDRFDDLVQTNLVGTYSCLRAAQRHLLPPDSPRQLVVISSILGRFGVPGYTGYCASKTALIGLVRAFAMELADQGVRVNAICPGWVDTDMAWQGIDGMAEAMGVTRDEAFATAMQAVPLGRMGKPEEVAGLVAWLLGPDGGAVTGQGIDINCGAWMG